MSSVNYREVMQYFFHCVDLGEHLAEYGRKQEDLTPYEVIRLFVDVYKIEMGRDDITQAELADWLQGLPSVAAIPFMNVEILEWAKEYGFNVSTERKEDKFLENWFMFAAMQYIKLYKKSPRAINKYIKQEA